MLIVYDAAGKIIMTASGEFDGVKTNVIDVPTGYMVESVNPETDMPVLIPVAATDADRVEALEKQFAAYVQNAAHGDDVIPFVYGMAVKKGNTYGYAGKSYKWIDNDCAACVWLPDSGIWQWKQTSEGVTE